MSKINEIEKLGLSNMGKVYYNLSYDELFAHEVKNNEGFVTSNGTFSVDTGIFTGRSPKDKYFVDQDPSNKYISWGRINSKVTKETFEKLFEKVKKQLSNKDIYIQDAFSGGSLGSRKSLRVVTEIAWQAHFVKNMFIRPTQQELEVFKPDFTLYNACKISNEDYKEQGLHSDVFVVFNVFSRLFIKELAAFVVFIFTTSSAKLRAVFSSNPAFIKTLAASVALSA